MGVFLIPTSLCEEMERMMNLFYWGSKKNGRRDINWMRWGKLTLHKSLGGFGFCNMEAFNLLMLGKQGWKLMHDSNSLLTRTLKAKYFPRRDFLEAPLGHNPSYTWRSLWSTQSLLTLGHRWKIGDGSKINMWSMPWIRDLPSCKPLTPPPPQYGDVTVNSLMNFDMNSWNSMLLHSLLSATDAAAVLSIPPYPHRREDIRIWKATNDGHYSVKSAYRVCIDLFHSSTTHNANNSWMTLWNLQVPHRVRPFLWRLAHQCLPTHTNLITRGIHCDDSCVTCDALAETHMHTFFVCSKAITCWDLLGLGNLVHELLQTADDFTALLFEFLRRLSLTQQQSAAMLLWSLWKSRNFKLWDALDTSSAFTVSRARDTLQEWSCMQRAKK